MNDFPRASPEVCGRTEQRTEPRSVGHTIALLARVQGDEARYRDYRDRYRDMARTLGFEGHVAWAEAMA
jgi:hypothetical protein